jgi:hemolysin activation/secretion protein
MRGWLAVPSLLLILADPGLAQPGSGFAVPPQGTPVPQLAPPAVPRVGPSPARPTVGAPGAAAEAGSVGVTAVSVEGASAFPAAELEAAARIAPGPAVPLAEIEAVRLALLNRYREAGYVFTTVDAVVGADGRLRFVVNEGEITEVRLDGDIGPAGTQVLRFLNRLVGLRPLDIATLERQLLLAQEIPGIAIRTVLRPAGTAPGALSLIAQVARRPVSGYVTADNRGFRLTGPQQGLAVVQLNAFSEFGERTELALFYAAGRTQVFGQASTELFLGGSGLRLRLTAGQGASTPSDALRALGYEARTTLAGIGLSYPLIRSRQQTVTLTGGFDLIESEIRLDDPEGNSRTFSEDSLRVARLGAEWAGYDLAFGNARPGVNTLLLRFSQGIAGLGASSNGSPELSRASARTDFTKTVFDASRVQTLLSPWPEATLALQATLAGQWTDDVLPQAEKFYLGGARLGRGFYAGEVTGDRALAASLELQLATTLDTEAFGRRIRLDPLFYAFYDRGRSFENRREDADRRLSSAGLGLRMSLAENAELQLEGVRRLTRRTGGASADELKADAIFWRVLFRY